MDRPGVRESRIGKERQDLLAGATGDCNNCPHWRRKGSKFSGVRIPKGQWGWGYGKCSRPQGHCHPRAVKS